MLPSRYTAGVKQKGVDKRAGLLESEYRKKARDVDRDHVGTPDGQEGPVLRHLNQYGDVLGLVVEAWGEGSEDLHNLLRTIALSRLSAIGLARGRPGSEEELAVIVGQVRRRLSVAAIRANSTCLLSRLSLIGEEARRAADRRGWRHSEEEIMRKEREAQWLGQVRSHGVQHRGEFCLL